MKSFIVIISFYLVFYIGSINYAILNVTCKAYDVWLSYSFSKEPETHQVLEMIQDKMFRDSSPEELAEKCR